MFDYMLDFIAAVLSLVAGGWYFSLGNRSMSLKVY